MNKSKLLVSALFVLGCALFAISLGLPAATLAQSNAQVNQTPSLNLTRATSISDVSKIKTDLLAAIDDALKTPEVRRGATTILLTKCCKDNVDKMLVKTTNPSLAMHAMPESDLKDLREIIKARFDAAINTNANPDSLGTGKVSSLVFTTKMEGTLIKGQKLGTPSAVSVSPGDSRISAPAQQPSTPAHISSPPQPTPTP